MKTENVSTNNIVKGFDIELRDILLSDLENARIAKNASVKNEKILMTA